MYHRNFKKRDHSLSLTVKTLFAAAGLLEIEKLIWKHRVKVAAAISRIRIKHSALKLNDLLPAHLKEEKVTNSNNNNPVTCWINDQKIK